MSNGTSAKEVWQKILTEKPAGLSGRVRYEVAKHAMKLGGVSFSEVGRETGFTGNSIRIFAHNQHASSGPLLDALASWCGYDAR